MSRKSISWILDFASKLPNEEEKIKCLQANNTNALLIILKIAYDPNVKWDLPEGDPPYNPCEFPNQENMLYQEARKLYLFLEGGNPDLHKIKRETMFINLLGSVEPSDAKLLLAIKNKKLPYPGLNSDIILKAFPGLW
jgi:Family of unknown function (DUF6433)